MIYNFKTITKGGAPVFLKASDTILQTSTNRSIKTRFDYLKKNLYHMAELLLEHLLFLCDALERDDYERAQNLIQKDDLIDEFEKKNDNISQSAILDAIAAREHMGLNVFHSERLLKHDPLRFSLSAIRVTIYLEQTGDKFVNIAEAFIGQKLPKALFLKNATLNHALSRMATAVGMVVESLVEEKERFFGSVRDVTGELNTLCAQAMRESLRNKTFSSAQICNLTTIIQNIDYVGSLSLNIAEELVRLSTGEDIRHFKD